MAISYQQDLLATLLPHWHQLLQGWSADGSLVAAAQEALLLEEEPQALTDLVTQWSAGDFSGIPPIVLLSSSDISDAMGAYAISTGTIYLNQDWLLTATQEQVNAVLTEELGHHLDGLLNAVDTPGDEGEYFSRIMLGEELDEQEIQAIRSERDAALLLLPDGNHIRAEAATLTGGEGNDSIIGTNSADTINGRGGDDTIDGGAGTDVLDGGTGNDIVSGGDGNDIIDSNGGDGADTLYGGSGDDRFTLRASANYSTPDIIKAEEGNDYADIVAHGISLVDMGPGEDYIKISLYIDSTWAWQPRTIRGGDGFDILEFGEFHDARPSYPSAATQLSLYLDISGIERIVAGTAIPALILSDSSFSRAYSEHLEFEGSRYGGIDASNIRLPIRVHGNGIFSGTTGSDYFDARQTPYETSPDTFKGNGGDDYFNGGDGIDTAAFSGDSSDYEVAEMAYNQFQVVDKRPGSPDGTDTIVDVNILRFADEDQQVVIKGLKFIGDDYAEEINGSGYADFIDGSGGNDLIAGGGGNDNLLGGVGDDYLYAGSGDDVVLGGTGNDQIVGGDGKGNDAYEGGFGIDTVIYKSSLNNPIVVDLRTGVATGLEIGTDSLKEIENVTAGQADDILTGDSQDNTFDGLAGNDSVSFQGARDRYQISRNSSGSLIVQDAIIGGDGKDTLANIEYLKFSDRSYTIAEAVEPRRLTGGTGTQITLAANDDIISFSAPSFSAIRSTPITGFDPAKDSLSLSSSTFASASSAKMFTVRSLVSTGNKKRDKKAKKVQTTRRKRIGTTGDSFIYNQITGQLIYDQNGKAPGFGEGGAFATFTDKPLLSSSNLSLA